jgi:hypothetical protein
VPEGAETTDESSDSGDLDENGPNIDNAQVYEAADDSDDSEEVPDNQDEDNADEIADYGYLFGHGGNAEDDAEPDEDYQLEGYQNSTQAVDAAEDSDSDVFSGTDSDQEAEDEYGEYGFGSY